MDLSIMLTNGLWDWIGTAKIASWIGYPKKDSHRFLYYFYVIISLWIHALTCIKYTLGLSSLGGMSSISFAVLPESSGSEWALPLLDSRFTNGFVLSFFSTLLRFRNNTEKSPFDFLDGEIANFPFVPSNSSSSSRCSFLLKTKQHKKKIFAKTISIRTTKQTMKATNHLPLWSLGQLTRGPGVGGLNVVFVDILEVVCSVRVVVFCVIDPVVTRFLVILPGVLLVSLTVVGLAVDAEIKVQLHEILRKKQRG